MNTAYIIPLLAVIGIIVLVYITVIQTKKELRENAKFYNAAQEIEDSIRAGKPQGMVKTKIWVLDGYSKSTYQKQRVVELCKMYEVKYDDAILKKHNPTQPTIKTKSL